MEGEEVYGIDREHAHARAIELIPEDFFWDPADEWSPFGSDEGDMALADFRGWRADNPGAPAFEGLAETIEVAGEMNVEDYNRTLVDRNLIRRQMKDSYFDDYKYIFALDTFVIATGFAQLVDEGKIDADCKPCIQVAIDRQRIWGELSISEEYRDEYIDRLDVLSRILKQA